MAKDLIRGQKLSFTFEGKEPVTAVRNISFSVETGQIMAIIGESGSGKSTLLKLIYGLLAPKTGEIRFKGDKVPDPATVLIPGHPDMRMVSQNFEDLNTYATVWDNISSQLSNTNLSAKTSHTKRMLSSLRLTALRDHRVFDLSGGEKQRVAIAVALINKPQVLLLDEPFNQVDASFREMLQEDLLTIVSETGLTVIMVSHDPTEVMALADQLLIVRKGRKIANGHPAELFKLPPNAYVARLLAQANVLPATNAAILGIETNEKEIGIHRHAIRTKKDKNGHFQVQAIRFRGIHNELILKGPGFELRSLEQSSAPASSGFQEGDRVMVQVDDYWEFS